LSAKCIAKIILKYMEDIRLIRLMSDLPNKLETFADIHTD